MSRTVFIQTFYRQFDEFFGQLIQVFPSDQDFPAYKTGMSLFSKTNPLMVINAVREHVFPFEDIIRAKNEDFFLKHEFNEYTDDDAIDAVIRKIKNLWGVLTDANKAVVWSYIILLLDLAKRCVD